MSTGSESPASGLRLLIAEDHAVNRIVITKMIEILGHSAVVVENGSEALAMVQASHFDCVLLDIEMPVMNGLEAASAIRKLDGAVAQIPILALSAHTSPEHEREARLHGFTGFLSKPVGRQRLEEALAHHVRAR